MKLLKKSLFILLPIVVLNLLVFVISSRCSASEINISELKKGVVSVRGNRIKSAYSSKGGFYASGFLVDKKLGLVVTNEHVAPSYAVQEIFLTFFNGKEVKAKRLYTDPRHDISFLKVDPVELPEDCIEIKIADTDPKNEEKILIIGNSQNNNFSIQDGVINSLYSTITVLPTQSLTASVNVGGGSSGSPMFNKDGEALGMVFAGNDTFVYGIPAQYIRDILKSLKENKKPDRNDIGVLLKFDSLDRLIRFYNFPDNLAPSYLKKYPEYMNKAIVVSSTINGSPAQNILEPGDVIWKVNGKEIGANLYQFQKIMNESKSKISLTVYRDGKEINTELSLYDLNKTEVKRMLLVADSVFFEADDFIRAVSGVKLGSVVVRNIEKGSVFDVFPPSPNNDYYKLAQVTKIDTNAVEKLEDIITVLPRVIKKQYFPLDYIILSGYNSGYWGICIFSKRENRAQVAYNGYGTNPVMLEFNENTLEWDSKNISEQ